MVLQIPWIPPMGFLSSGRSAWQGERFREVSWMLLVLSWCQCKVLSCGSECWTCSTAGPRKMGSESMSKTGEIPACPPWAQPAAELSQPWEQPNPTTQRWGAGHGIRSHSWSINLHSWFTNNPHLILIWWGALTLYPPFKSFVMSFPHTWFSGGSVSEVPWTFSLGMLCIANNSVFSTTCVDQLLFLLALVQLGRDEITVKQVKSSQHSLETS